MKVAGRWVYLYRADDQYGQIIDVYASGRRDSENLRRGHYEIAAEQPGNRRLRVAFRDLAMAI